MSCPLVHVTQILMETKMKLWTKQNDPQLAELQLHSTHARACMAMELLEILPESILSIKSSTVYSRPLYCTRVYLRLTAISWV